jgi:transcriptional regulator with XRE-family HTH domain
MKLTAYLEKQKIGQTEFALSIQSTRQAVGNWMRGDRVPSPEMMRRIHTATKGRVTRRDFVDKYGMPLCKENVK